MKIAKGTFLFALLFILLAGCVHSEKPFYREKDLVFDPQFVGDWCAKDDVDAAGTNRLTWTFARAEGKAYELKASGMDGGKPIDMSFHVRLFQLEGERFFDFYPTKQEVSRASEKYGRIAFFLPTHTVIRTPKKGTNLVMAFLDPKKVEEHLKKRARKYEEYEGRFFLKGSTRQLQEMLRESLQKPDWWEDDLELVRCGK